MMRRPRVLAALVMVLPFALAPGAVAAPQTAPTAPVTRPAALIPTKVTGFPRAAVTVNSGAKVTVRATVSGPPKRLVTLQRLSGSRWSAVKTLRTTARRAVAFVVPTTRAGTTRYRLVVPRAGLFAARTTAAQIVTVKPADTRLVPQVITGAFSGGDAYATWQGTLELTSTGGTTWSNSDYFGVSWTYQVTKLTGTWSWTGYLPGVCTRSGGGTIALPDVATDTTFDATGMHQVSATDYFDPWSSKGLGAIYDFRLRFTNDVRWHYTDTCPDSGGGAPTVTTGDRGAPFLALATADGIDTNAGLQGPLPTSDGSTFAGTVPQNYQGTTFAWNLTGDLHFPRPRPS